MWLAGLVNSERDKQFFSVDYPPEHDQLKLEGIDSWIWCPICTWCLCGYCILADDGEMQYTVSNNNTATYTCHPGLRYPFLFDYPALDKCMDTKL
jgi:hypothetical protein